MSIEDKALFFKQAREALDTVEAQADTEGLKGLRDLAMAFTSVGNMFWKEYFQRLEKGFDNE